MKQKIKTVLLVCIGTLSLLPVWAQSTSTNKFSVPLWGIAVSLYLVSMLVSYIMELKKKSAYSSQISLISFLSAIWASFLVASYWNADFTLIKEALVIFAFLLSLFATFRASGILFEEENENSYYLGIGSMIIYAICMYFA